MKYMKIHGNDCGYFSTILQIIDNLFYCDNNGFIPTIYCNNPLYTDNTDMFSDYFEPISIDIPDGHEVITSVNSFRGEMFGINFLTANPEYRVSLNKIIQKYFKLNARVEKKLNQLLISNDMAGVTGIHIRGGEGRASRTGPWQTDLCNFEHYYNILKDETGKIFVATDNNEILKFLSERFGDDRIITQEIYRCESFHNQGLHYDMTQDKYQKGEGVLIDMLALANCKKIFGLQSNVSVAAYLWNKNVVFERYDCGADCY